MIYDCLEDMRGYFMYRFKFYYKDGTKEVSSFGLENIEDLYYDFDGLIEWNEYYSFDELKPTGHEILEVAMRAYKGFYKDFYRIEIINDESNEIIDYINEGDLIHENLKRKKIIQKYEVEDLKEKNRKRKSSDLVYSFKIYYKDGSSEIMGSAISIKSLLYCLDEYLGDKIYEVKNNLGTKDILKIALSAYGKMFKIFKVAIINSKTGDIIDYIDDNNLNV